MSIGARVILRPIGVAFAPASVGAAAESDAEANLRIHQTGENEFGGIAIVGWGGEIVVLHAREFTEGALEGVQAPEHYNHSCGEPPEFRDSHETIPDESVADARGYNSATRRF